MAWYNEPENSKILSESGNVPKDQVDHFLEAVHLDGDQVKAFAKKYGLETTKDADGEYISIPSEQFKDANFSGQFLDFWLGSTSEKLALEQKRQIRNNSYKLMDEISGETSLALDTYADEALGVGFLEQPIEIKIENTSSEVEETVREILNRNNILQHSRDHLRNTTKWGDLLWHLLLPEESNDPLKIQIKSHTPDCWVAFSPNNCKVSVGYSITPETLKSASSTSALNRARIDKNELIQPWEAVQISVYNSEFAPYGRGLLENFRTEFDQLVTIEALLAMSRATRVERLLVKIPTGSTNPTAALAKLSDLKSRYKNTIFKNKQGRNSYAKNPAMQDIMFVPADDGFGVERLQAGSGVEISNTDDVEYFRDKLLMSTGLPKGYLLADESTDRYHALAQQDLKFARKLIPFQNSYAEGLTKLVVLLVGYAGGDVDTVDVTVSIKRPVQISDTILSQIEAATRTASELIDNYKRSREDNEGNQPDVPNDLFAKILAQLGMPEDLLKLLDAIPSNDPSVIQPNTPDDDNISKVTLDDVLNERKIKYEIVASFNSKQLKKSNSELFDHFKSRSNNNLLVEFMELKGSKSKEDKVKIKKLNMFESKNVPKLKF